MDGWRCGYGDTPVDKLTIDRNLFINNLLQTAASLPELFDL
jgi:hypothetical protein